MLNADRNYAKDYDLISTQFFAGNGIETAKRIFSFLKKNIRYKVESVSNQRIMSPAAILNLQQNDCKNYALFTVGILQSLKRKGLIKNKSFFRFVSYQLLDQTPHHVYAVMIDNKGREISIDPVLNQFNEQKFYTNKIDKMPLYAISGIGAKSAKAPKIVKRPIVARIALAPARGSFLLLVGLNFMGLATKLASAFQNKKDATNTWWSRLGGNTNELLRKVEQGAKKKRILGEYNEGSIGDPTLVAASTAAPILVKVATFLKSIGINPADIANAGKKVIADQIRKKLEPIEKNKTIQAEVSQITTQEAVNTLENDLIKKNVLIQEQAKKNQINNILPLLFIGGIGFLIITKKIK
jgi:hypothetical protein